MGDVLNAFEQASQRYPVLRQHDIKYKDNIGGGPGYMESWPAGEPGTPEQPRPKDFPMNSFGVENFRADSRPIDVLGDVVSHHLTTADPNIKSTYDNFKNSLTPEQHTRLQEQYAHAQKHEGETRPFEAWRDNSGIPAYFRGHPFDQWKDSASLYTPQQRGSLDDMMSYLQGTPPR